MWHRSLALAAGTGAGCVDFSVCQEVYFLTNVAHLVRLEFGYCSHKRVRLSPVLSRHGERPESVAEVVVRLRAQLAPPLGALSLVMLMGTKFTAPLGALPLVSFVGTKLTAPLVTLPLFMFMGSKLTAPLGTLLLVMLVGAHLTAPLGTLLLVLFVGAELTAPLGTLLLGACFTMQLGDVSQLVKVSLPVAPLALVGQSTAPRCWCFGGRHRPLIHNGLGWMCFTKFQWKSKDMICQGNRNIIAISISLELIAGYSIPGPILVIISAASVIARHLYCLCYVIVPGTVLQFMFVNV